MRDAERYYRALAADLQRSVDEGWDPRVVIPIDPTPRETVATYCIAWASGQSYESAPQDADALGRYLPGSMLDRVTLDELRPRHLVELIEALRARPSARGGTLGARTIRSTCDVIRRALDRAVIDERIATNPWSVVRGHLPTIEDKDPLARAGWDWSWDEVAAMVHDPRLPAMHRVWNALAFGSGARPGELCVARWSDVDLDAEPLARLDVRRARKRVSREIGGTKTGAYKAVPLPEPVRAILGWWKGEGWAAQYGRDPGEDDLVVCSSAGTPIQESDWGEAFHADARALGLRERHPYTTRHAYVTRITDDGGDEAVTRWITHAPPKDSRSGYRRMQWARMCTEVARMRFPAPLGASVPPGTASSGADTGGDNMEKSNDYGCGQQDLKALSGAAWREHARDSTMFRSRESTRDGADSPREETLSAPRRATLAEALDATRAALTLAASAGEFELARTLLGALEGAGGGVAPVVRLAVLRGGRS
jgi:integrase